MSPVSRMSRNLEAIKISTIAKRQVNLEPKLYSREATKIVLIFMLSSTRDFFSASLLLAMVVLKVRDRGSRLESKKKSSRQIRVIGETGDSALTGPASLHMECSPTAQAQRASQKVSSL